MILKNILTKTTEFWGGDPDNYKRHGMSTPKPNGELLGRPRISATRKIDNFWGNFFQNFAWSYHMQYLVFFRRTWVKVVYLDVVNTPLGGGEGTNSNSFCVTMISSSFWGGQGKSGPFFVRLAWQRNFFLVFAPVTVSNVELSGESIATIHLFIREMVVEIFWKNMIFEKKARTRFDLPLRVLRIRR